MDRRQFLRGMGAAGLLLLSGAQCSSNPDLTKLVRKTEDGVLLDYVIIPESINSKERKFRNRAVQSRTDLYTPVLSDGRWLGHYSNLQRLLGEPVDNLSMHDVDPLFGRFAERVHPTRFTPRYFHTAVDIFQDEGTTVKATFDGTASLHKDEYGGNWVKLVHPIKTRDGYHLETRYLHLNEIDEAVTDGAKVEQGQPLGTLGGTGVMDGHFPHLHYEVVMVNLAGRGLPLVLDPSLTHFYQPQEGFSCSRTEPGYDNLTAEIRGREGVIDELAEVINGASPSDRRFLPLYKEFWDYAANEKKDTKATELLKLVK